MNINETVARLHGSLESTRLAIMAMVAHAALASRSPDPEGELMRFAQSGIGPAMLDGARALDRISSKIKNLTRAER